MLIQLVGDISDHISSIPISLSKWKLWIETTHPKQFVSTQEDKELTKTNTV